MTAINRELYEALMAADAAESVPIESDLVTKSNLKDTELRFVRWMLLLAGLVMAVGRFL